MYTIRAVLLKICRGSHDCGPNLSSYYTRSLCVVPAPVRHVLLCSYHNAILSTFAVCNTALVSPADALLEVIESTENGIRSICLRRRLAVIDSRTSPVMREAVST